VWLQRLSLVESNVLDLVHWVRQMPITSCHVLLESTEYLVCVVPFYNSRYFILELVMGSKTTVNVRFLPAYEVESYCSSSD
jgi:hypothetical protein